MLSGVYMRRRTFLSIKGGGHGLNLEEIFLPGNKQTQEEQVISATSGKTLGQTGWAEWVGFCI